MAQVSKICSNGAQSINLFPNVSKPQIPKSSNLHPLKSHFLGSSNSLSLKLKYGFAGSFTVGKFRVDPLRIAASVATAEKPLTVPEIVLQPIEEISGTIKLPGSKSLSNRILLISHSFLIQLFIRTGSWLVRLLLHRDYTVDATVEDLQDEGEMNHLKALVEGAESRIRLFQADLLDCNSKPAVVLEQDVRPGYRPSRVLEPHQQTASWFGTYWSSLGTSCNFGLLRLANFRWPRLRLRPSSRIVTCEESSAAAAVRTYDE